MENAHADAIAASILIVDDSPENLQCLSGMFQEAGYRVRAARSGPLALQAAQNDPPDLILLDVNMPGMNGYEVCWRSKTNELLKDIPIIFISALHETIDKVRAFGVGGVDYVTKPFQFDEIHARVEAHLELRRRRKELQESYLKLKALEELRDDLVHMIVHDLRSPIWGVHNCLRLIKDSLEGGQAGKAADYAEIALGATAAALDMILAILDVSKLESRATMLHVTEFDLADVLAEAVEKAGPLKGPRQLSLDHVEGPLIVRADSGLITRVIQNLVDNAVHFTRKEDGRIAFRAKRQDNAVRVFVQDNGFGIPAEAQATVFEKFGPASGKSEAVKYSVGLGLAFCKMAVEAHGGRIGVESEVGHGSTFWFDLPVGGPVQSPPATEDPSKAAR